MKTCRMVQFPSVMRRYVSFNSFFSFNLGFFCFVFFSKIQGQVASAPQGVLSHYLKCMKMSCSNQAVQSGYIFNESINQ